MLKGKILAEVTAACTILGMAACEKNDVPEVQAAQDNSTSISENETNSQTVKSDTEILMPDGWTNEDFYNFFVINGKTLSQPTTLNGLMELDDKFTYDVVDYIDENSIDYKDRKYFGVNVYYNHQFLFATIIFSEENDEKAMLDIPMCVVIFKKNLCQKAGIDVATTCGLDYNSTYDDIEKIFGVPNYDGVHYPVQYKFNDEKYLYFLKFDFNEDTQKIDKFNFAIYDVDFAIYNLD